MALRADFDEMANELGRGAIRTVAYAARAIGMAIGFDKMRKATLIHTGDDSTVKDQIELAGTVLRLMDNDGVSTEVVTLGVEAQSSHEAEESHRKKIALIEEAHILHEDLRRYLESNGIDTAFLAPASDDYFAELLEKMEVGLSDHANGQKLQNKKWAELAAEYAAKFPNLKIDIPVWVFCWRHKTSVLSVHMAEGEQRYLASILPEAPKPEQRQDTIINNVLYKTHKLLSHLTGAYVFGHGQAFCTWLEDHKPKHWQHMKMLRHETSRHDVQFENCMHLNLMCESALEYLQELEFADSNPEGLRAQVIGYLSSDVVTLLSRSVLKSPSICSKFCVK